MTPKYREARRSWGSKTTAEVFFGRKLEEVPTRTFSALGKAFYGRPWVGEG